jgi:putative membrane protein
MVGHAWQRFAMVAGCASLVTMVACGGGDTATDTLSTTAGGDVARPADTAAGAMAPGTPAGTAPGTTTMTISGGQPELVQVMAEINRSEIAVGQLAQRQARNAQVKTFARTLANEHTQGLRRIRQIARSANIPLDTTDVSARSDTAAAATGASATGATGPVVTQLRTMHQQTMDRLRNLQGADFDTAFMNAQVIAHQQALDLLQQSQGQAQDSTLQRHVTTATESVRKHLDRARELQQTVTSAATGAAGDTARRGTGADTGRRP